MIYLKRILILTANPIDTNHLALGREVKEIDQALRRAKQFRRDIFERLYYMWNVTPREMQEEIMSVAPQIIHFSGHGTEQGIILEDNVGQSKFVNGAALAQLFSLFDFVECVVLHACYTQEQAKLICEYVPYVIYVKAELPDDMAIAFSTSFYFCLGSGNNYERAFKIASSDLDIRVGGADSKSEIYINANLIQNLGKYQSQQSYRIEIQNNYPPFKWSIVIAGVVVTNIILILLTVVMYLIIL